jgi:hypothetical protein
MEQYLELISVPAIVVVVYFIIEIIKKAVGNNETFNRFIPLIAAALGIVCGIVCYYAIPSIIPASNVVVAIIIGGASGLSATGTNQIIKQLTKDKTDSGDDKGDDKTE